MGLFKNTNNEPVYCLVCNKELKGPLLLTPKTASGSYICTNCFCEKHLDDIDTALHTMTDEEVDLHLELMDSNALNAQMFDAKIKLPHFKLEIDPLRQWVKFDKHHYIFDISDFVAVVYGLTIDGGHAKGELQFYTVDPLYSFRRVKVNASLRGLFKSAQEKNLIELLKELSTVLGDLPILSPKEFKHAFPRLLEEKQKEFADELGLNQITQNEFEDRS